MARIVVVGGGIAGLAAARTARASGHDVVLVESTGEVGGKVRRREVAGVLVDVGAEAMLNRRPEGVELAAAVGIEVVHPALAASTIWTGGALRPLPRTLMGAPLDVEGLAESGILSDSELQLVRNEARLKPSILTTDISVGDLIDQRFGSAVTDLLVEPLLGGVYAGRAREISARAAVPQLLAMAERGSILGQAPQAPATYAAPVFAGIAGGMGLLPAALLEALVADGGEVRLHETVRGLQRETTGFRVALDSEILHADGVVLATPAAPTARLIAPLAPVAATELSRFEAASVVVVTFAFRADDVPDLATTTSSGFLVPPVAGRRIKASTFSFAMWAWVREAGQGAGPDGEDLLFLRTSLGRHREEASLQVSDDDLVAASLLDLAAAIGVRARPVDVHVQRWGGGLPQVAVGHVERVARIRADVAGVAGLAVCGAAYDGVGIPAVIASAQRAAAEVVAALGPALGTMES